MVKNREAANPGGLLRVRHDLVAVKTQNDRGKNTEWKEENWKRKNMWGRKVESKDVVTTGRGQELDSLKRIQTA